MLLPAAACSQTSTGQWQNRAPSLTEMSREGQYRKQVLGPAAPQDGKTAVLFHWCWTGEVQHHPPHLLLVVNLCHPLCASSSILNPSKSQLSSPRQIEKNLILSWCFMDLSNGTGPNASTREKRQGPRPPLFPAATHGLAQQARSCHPEIRFKNNSLDRKVGGRKVFQKWCSPHYQSTTDTW